MAMAAWPPSRGSRGSMLKMPMNMLIWKNRASRKATRFSTSDDPIWTTPMIEIRRPSPSSADAPDPPDPEDPRSFASPTLSAKSLSPSGLKKLANAWKLRPVNRTISPGARAMAVPSPRGSSEKCLDVATPRKGDPTSPPSSAGRGRSSALSVRSAPPRRTPVGRVGEAAPGEPDDAEQQHEQHERLREVHE